MPTRTLQNSQQIFDFGTSKIFEYSSNVEYLADDWLDHIEEDFLWDLIEQLRTYQNYFQKIDVLCLLKVFNIRAIFYFFKLDFCKRNNVKIILLIIFYVYSLLLLFFLY